MCSVVLKMQNLERRENRKCQPLEFAEISSQSLSFSQNEERRY